MSIKVSVIMPSLNVGTYIKQCIDSVSGQSLKELEIICVDAGSTDGTLEILQDAASNDPRIRIVHSDVRSYGYQMNLGLKEASGEYIGIVETDDYVEPEMFENLYRIAKEDDLDAVKSDFWLYYSKLQERNQLFKLPGRFTKMPAFCPLTDLKTAEDKAEFFNIKPSIWSAIYRRAFLEDNSIVFNETPGASYQDAGFNFKVWACANRVRLIPDAFLHYRQDNEQSSVNSPAKAYCVCDEYREIERFITDRFADDDRQAELFSLMERLKYDSYMWNYDRLEQSLGEEFIKSVSEELAEDEKKGYAREEYFPSFKWSSYMQWINDPDAFASEVLRAKNRSFAKRAFDKLGRMLKK